jgi:hypothetical protein
MSGAAQASSTFATGPGEPVKAQAHLDFTIHIPLTVILERPAKGESAKAARPGVSASGNSSPGAEPISASANGGTLIITSSLSDEERARVSSKDAKASRANRGYLIAMP